MADLIRHLADTFDGWWTQTLRTSGLDEFNPVEFFAGSTSPFPSGPDGLVESFVGAAEAWLAETENVDPAKPRWTFRGPGRADFWFGRHSTELALHRWDAEGAFIDAPSIPPERASE